MFARAAGRPGIVAAREIVRSRGARAQPATCSVADWGSRLSSRSPSTAPAATPALAQASGESTRNRTDRTEGPQVATLGAVNAAILLSVPEA